MQGDCYDATDIHPWTTAAGPGRRGLCRGIGLPSRRGVHVRASRTSGRAFDASDAVLTATAIDVPGYPRRSTIYIYRGLREIDEVLGTELADLERSVVFEVDASWKGVETTRAVAPYSDRSLSVIPILA